MRLERALLAYSTIGSILVLFLLIPIVVCLVLGIPEVSGLTRDYEALRALALSIEAAGISTIISALFGTPLAYALSRFKSRLSDAIEGIIQIPIAVPHSVAGIMILLAYSSRMPIGSMLERLGVIIEDTLWGVIAAMTFVSSPIYVMTAKSTFDSIDVEYEYVARTLGASALRAFMDVVLPQAWRGLLTASILTFSRALSEVGAIMIVAYYPKVASVLVIERFLEGGLKGVLPLATALLLISLITAIALKLSSGKRA